MIGSELGRRIAVAAIGIPAAILIVYAGGWVLGISLAIVAALGAIEFYALIVRSGARPFIGAGAGAAAGLVLLATIRRAEPAAAPALWLFTLIFLLAISVVAIRARGPEGHPASSVAATVFGAVYPGATLAYALFLRHLVDDGGALSTTGAVLGGATGARAGGAGIDASGAWTGAALLIFPIGLTWFGDACAYFFGTTWGRHRLIPSVSPKKSVEGAVASLVGCTAAGAAYAAFVFESWLGLPVGPVAGAIGGALISVLAQLGDLVESLFKRDAGVKDSGRIFPGHGGVLDRFDALFFSIPAAYWYLAWLLERGAGGAPWP